MSLYYTKRKFNYNFYVTCHTCDFHMHKYSVLCGGLYGVSSIVVWVSQCHVLTLSRMAYASGTMFVNFAEISKSCAKTLLLVLNGCCIKWGCDEGCPKIDIRLHPEISSITKHLQSVSTPGFALEVPVPVGTRLLALCTFMFAVVDTGVVRSYGEERASGTFVGDVIIIVTCLLLIAVAAFGSVGAVRGNVKILYFYIAFLMIMVILELLLAIYVALQRYGLEFRVSEWLREDFFRNTTEEDTIHNKLWDDLQVTYECCGLNGPEDYVAVRKEISLSCCPRAFRARTAFARQQMYRACIESSSYYKDGCEDEILYTLRADADWLIGVAVTCFWFEAAGMLLAMWVANNIRDEVQVYKPTIRY